MGFIEFAQEQFEKQGKLPEFVEISIQVWNSIKDYLRTHYVSEFLGNVIVTDLKVKRGEANIYFEEEIANYKLP